MITIRKIEMNHVGRQRKRETLHNIHDENHCVDDQTKWRHCINSHFLQPQPMLSIAKNPPDDSWAHGDNLGNFCASHEHSSRMHNGVVNGPRPLHNHKKKLRTWKSEGHSAKPHCNDNKCNNTLITFTVGLAQLPISATHHHWKGSICGKQTGISFTLSKSVPMHFRGPFYVQSDSSGTEQGR